MFIAHSNLFCDKLHKTKYSLCTTNVISLSIFICFTYSCELSPTSIPNFAEMKTSESVYPTNSVTRCGNLSQFWWFLEAFGNNIGPETRAQVWRHITLSTVLTQEEIQDEGGWQKKYLKELKTLPQNDSTTKAEKRKDKW